MSEAFWCVRSPDDDRTEIVENFSSEKNSFFLECFKNFSQNFFYQILDRKKNQTKNEIFGNYYFRTSKRITLY